MQNRKDSLRSLISSLFIFVLTLFIIVCLAPSHSQALLGIKEGDAPKEITLNDLDGKEIPVSDFFGKKPVILVFWELLLDESFLNYSLDELRFLNEMYSRYHAKSGLEIFGIYTPEDEKGVPEAEMTKVRDLIVSNKIQFPVLIDTGLAYFREYGIIALPSTVMVNRAGKIESIYPSFPLAARPLISDQIKKIVGLDKPEQKKGRGELKKKGSPSNRHYQYSLQMFKSGLREQALSALNKSIASDKNFSWAYNLKGIILWQQGNATGATEEFRRALEVDNNIAAHINFAILLSEQKRYTEAEKVIKSAAYTRIDYKIRAHYLLGLAYEHMDKIDLAIRELELAESLFDVWASENEDSMFYTFSYRIPILRDLSEMYSRRGHGKKAMERLQKAVNIALSHDFGSGTDPFNRVRRGYMVYE
jgi:tetratricopeptide (TPR) repeat protein